MNSLKHSEKIKNMEHCMSFKDDFLKINPKPKRVTRKSIPDSLAKDCIELYKMGFPVKMIARHAGVGYDALLRATKDMRLNNETSK